MNENNATVKIGNLLKMTVELKREVVDNNINPTIQALLLTFYQSCDCAGMTTIRINTVDKKEVLKLANALKKFADTFEQ